jgi:hypothetical protein
VGRRADAVARVGRARRRRVEAEDDEGSGAAEETATAAKSFLGDGSTLLLRLDEEELE